MSTGTLKNCLLIILIITVDLYFCILKLVSVVGYLFAVFTSTITCKRKFNHTTINVDSMFACYQPAWLIL